MYVVVGCSRTHNKLGLACSLFIIIIATIKPKKKKWHSLVYVVYFVKETKERVDQTPARFVAVMHACTVVSAVGIGYHKQRKWSRKS